MWDWLGPGRLFCHKYFVIPKCVFVTILLKIWLKIVNTNGTQMLIFRPSLKMSKNIYLTNIVILEKGIVQVFSQNSIVLREATNGYKTWRDNRHVHVTMP